MCTHTQTCLRKDYMSYYRNRVTSVPSKVKETACYHPGALIKATKNIYSSSTDPMFEAEIIKEGTVGILVQRHDDGYHWNVHFLGRHEPWWCASVEFEPHNLNQMKK